MTNLVLTVIAVTTQSVVAETVVTFIELGFCRTQLVFALEHVLFERGMDLNRIIGAICVYMLLGIFIGLLNHLVFAGFRARSTASTRLTRARRISP